MREFFLSLGLAALAYFSPLYEMFVVLMLFVAADLVTGILASKRRNIPRTSRRLRKSAAKLVNYILALVLAYAAERAFDVEWFVAHRAIGAFICAVEMLSILENMAVITAHPDLVREIINEKNDLPDGGAPGAARDAGRMRGEAADDGIERKTDNRQRSHS